MGAPDDHGEFGHVDTGDGGDKFRAVLGDATRLVGLADHEPGDVLQEHEGDSSLAAQFNEVSAFLAGFGEQDAVVGHDAHFMAVDVCKPAHQRGPVP